MATTTLYTPWYLDEFDSLVAGVAPIVKKGTVVDNTQVAAVQAAAISAFGFMLSTTPGGVGPTPIPVSGLPSLTSQDGKVLAVAPGGSGVIWVDEAGVLAGSYQLVVSPDADTATTGTLQANKHHYISASGGNVSRALPTGQAQGTQILLEKSDSSTNTVSATGSIRGVGSSTFTLSLSHQLITFVADSSGSWWPFQGHITLGSLQTLFQPLDPDLTALAALTPSDTQVPSWSTSLGAWTVTNPSGSSEIAYAENVSGTTQAVATGAGSAVDVTGCSITVTNSGGRPVWITAKVVGTTASTTGADMILYLTETTSGSVDLDASVATPRATSGSAVSPWISRRIGVVTTSRTFKLRAQADGAALTLQNSSEFPSWIAALAR